MMLAAAELSSLRANTLAFIRANPVSLALVPRVQTKTGSGNVWSDGTPRISQTFRLIDQSTEHGPQPGLVRTSDGQDRFADFMLLGVHDATVERWDSWEQDGKVYEVAEIFPANQYEMRAWVVARG